MARENLAMAVLLGVPGGRVLGRVLRNARVFPPPPSPAVVVPAVVSAAKAAAKGAAKTPPAPAAAKTGAKAAKTAPKSAAKTPTAAPPDISPNPVNAIDDAIKKVETPLFIPERLAKIYHEVMKILGQGSVVALLGKGGDLGCADTCPFLGNGEYRLPTKQPAEAEKEPAVVAEKDLPVAEKEPTVAAEKKEPTVAAENKCAVAVDNKCAVALDKKSAEADDTPSPGRPCFYHEMGNKADDLLFKGYNTGMKLILDCSTDVMLADGRKLPKLDFVASTETKDIKLWIDHTMNPGLMGVLSLQHDSEVNLRYRKPLLSATASSKFKPWPVVSISGVIGTKSIAFGADVSLDTRSLKFPESSVGLSLSKGELSASLIMKNDDVLVASCHHKVDEATSFAANIHHVLSSNKSKVTVGGSHLIDDSTMLKGKINTDGNVCVVLKRALNPKCYVSISAESDCFRGSGSGTKFGLCISLGA